MLQLVICSLGTHFHCFLEEKLQVREMFTQVVQGTHLLQVVCSWVGAQGPLLSSVMSPSDLLQLLADGSRHHQVGSASLRSDWYCRLLVFRFLYPPGPWLEGVEGRCAGAAPPGYHSFSCLEGTLELFHFKGSKMSRLSDLGSGSTIHELKHT